MRRTLLVSALVLALPTPAFACRPGVDADGNLTRSVVSSQAPERSNDARPSTAPKAVPQLTVTTVASGLSHAWDVKPITDGDLLITEREPARLTISTSGGTQRTVAFPTGRIWQAGETGLMGLEIDPGFADNGRFYTCSGWIKDGGGHDIRVNAWTLNDAHTKATLKRPLLTGLPTSSGRHGGCRLLIATSGALIVGTGDAAIGTNPQNLRSLGGKTLRLDRITGKPWPENAFIGADNRNQRYLLTYGHRNVQGLAQRRDGSLWSVEHGPDRDDEVNKLISGGNYGWNPVPGYNEDVPMTDQGLPGRQIGARWRSGFPTLATSGATFVYGTQWGSLDGALAVAVLKSERMIFIKFDAAGRNPQVFTPAALRSYGRLRTATRLANGDLLVATDGDEGTDKILLVHPR